jgi:hypothetical protein
LPDKYELSVAAMNSEEATYHATTDDSDQSSSQAHSKAGHGKAKPRISTARRWTHFPSVAIYELKSRQTAVLIVLLFVTFLAHFYAADLKGIWNDEAVRLTIANGGLATAPFEKRHPGHCADVLRTIGNFAMQPAYPLLVNRILRLTHSYSVVPIVTTNLLIFLSSAVGIYLLARSLLSAWGALLAVLLYLWNGFAMVHVLQVREYPLILCLLVWNTFFFYLLFRVSPRSGRRIFWWNALAYCLTAGAFLYTTQWAPVFLWPHAVIALLALRRKPRPALTVWASLGVVGLSWLPWLPMSSLKNSLLYRISDPRPSSVTSLLARLHGPTEYLLIGSQQTGLSLLTMYYWLVLAVFAGGVVCFALRFPRQRFETQHLVLTTLGFLAFQIGYFFLRGPLSTWPRYFILYLPYIALLIPLTLSRLVIWAAPSMARRAWLQITLVLLIAAAGLGQIANNYKNPFVDHGPDFRMVCRYLISRVAPSDKIVISESGNLMALNYYWPSPRQIQFRYGAKPDDGTGAHRKVWIVSYLREDIPAYRAYASRLESLGYKLTATQIISGVTIRCFQRGP